MNDAHPATDYDLNVKLDAPHRPAVAAVRHHKAEVAAPLKTGAPMGISSQLSYYRTPALSTTSNPLNSIWGSSVPRQGEPRTTRKHLACIRAWLGLLHFSSVYLQCSNSSQRDEVCHPWVNLVRTPPPAPAPLCKRD
jgi:hypothetical protein